MPLLEIEDLSIGFHTERGLARVVGDLSFTVEAGRIVGLVGESGCGKSVTARAIMRLLPSPPAEVEADRIALDGENLLALDERAMRDVDAVAEQALAAWRTILPPMTGGC